MGVKSKFKIDDIMMTEIIFAAVIIAAVFLIVKIFARFVLRLVFILILLGGAGWLYYNMSTPADEMNAVQALYGLKNEHCGRSAGGVVCDCILAPVLDEFEATYRRRERNAIKQDNARARRIVGRLFLQEKEAMRQCLKEQGQEGRLNEIIEEVREKSGSLNMGVLKE